MVCKVLSLSCWCVIFTMNLAEQRYVFERARDRVMSVCTHHVYDVAICGNTAGNVASSCVRFEQHPQGSQAI